MFNRATILYIITKEQNESDHKLMDQIKIGNFIAQRRKEKQLTQAALGEKLGVSDKSVSKWERGQCQPNSTSFSCHM